MQGKANPRSPDERQDKRTQRAVLSLLIHEFPAQMTREGLRLHGLGSGDPLERAIGTLTTVGLLGCEGSVVLPTIAARHFDWLELS